MVMFRVNTILLWLACSHTIVAAPLPRERAPAARPPLTNRLFVMRHLDHAYFAYFGGDGMYWAGTIALPGNEAGGTSRRLAWAGRWRLERDLLVVFEHPIDACGMPSGEHPALIWTAELESGLWLGTYFDSHGKSGLFELKEHP